MTFFPYNLLLPTFKENKQTKRFMEAVWGARKERKCGGCTLAKQKCTLMVTYIHAYRLHEADDVHLRQPPASPLGMHILLLTDLALMEAI